MLKLLSCTFSAFLTSLASLSPHSSGTSLSASAYTSTLKVQLPSSMGRKDTDAVICRKSAAISFWISSSVFAGFVVVGGASGLLFSLSVVPALPVLEALDGSEKTLTLTDCQRPKPIRVPKIANIELPPLNVLASLLISDHNHQLGDLGFLHPFAELRHDFLDVCFDLVVTGRHHVEAILLHAAASESRLSYWSQWR